MLLLRSSETVGAGEIVTLTLNRPKRMNALSAELVGELVSALTEEARHEKPRVVVIRGAGRCFSAGVDLTAADKIFDKDAMKENGKEVFPESFDVPLALRRLKWPTIAAVHGPCYTGALEVALNCDVLLAAPDAVFADTHAGVGIAPCWGLSQLLSRRIGVNRALEMSLSTLPVDARTAADWGLANRVVSSLDSEVRRLAEGMLSAFPPVLTRYKQTLLKGADLALGDGLELERADAAEYYSTLGPEHFERLFAFLQAKKGRKSKL